MSQLRTIDIETPEDWIERAKAEHNPIRTFCLFSGGSDSLVVAHRCRDHYDELVFIDTQTAVPGVIDHVKKCAADLDKPLRILTQDFDVYEYLILGGTDPRGNEWQPLGFPGPGQHNRTYNRLKERALRRLMKDAKTGQPHNARVLGLSGIRRDESARRQGRMPLTRQGSFAFCNPLIDWTDAQMSDYRVEHNLRLSDISALLHRSGECNCGAFRTEGEREMLASLWPKWWHDRIEVLEQKAEDAGLRYCRWGGFDRDGNRASGEASKAGPLCSQCQVAGQLTLGGE